jgi:DME family drug/metabolite transporter
VLDRFIGPLFIGLAALLWGTDSLYRFPTSASLDPTFIVFCEHLGGLALLTPWIWIRHRADLFKLSVKDWLMALIIGAGGSATATVLFTASFRYLNPSVAILLQKFQPIFTVLLAFLCLGERPAPKFYFWAFVALIAGFVLSFPDLDVSFMREPGNLHAKGMTYALIAAGLWSLSTVAGRSLLTRVSPTISTFWRYAFGFATLSTFIVLARIPAHVGMISSRTIWMALAYLTVITGVLPMLAYYAGLARTPAIIATFVELLYPVSAVILNTLVLHTPLSPVQMGAGGALLFAVTMIAI